jgi:outer membrane protein assembly factor BamB
MLRVMNVAILLLIATGGSIIAADWPQWRGPRGNGIADEKNLPERWSATENVAWNATLSGLGVSSPIVSGDRVIVTSQIGTGVRRPGNHPRLAQGAATATAGERALAAPREAAGDHTYFVLLCDHPPASYLLALDTRTGKDRWKTDRGRGRSSYTTPFVVEAASGPELIVNSSERVDAYDPKSGGFLWHVGGPNQFPIPAPTFHDGIVYMSRGYRSGPYLAIRPGGRGDISSTHVVWQVNTGAPYISSLVYDAGLLYMANDVGAITVVDASTGNKVWQERVDGVFSASPVAADGKVYFVSETGETIVLRSGREPRIIARNDLGERLIASPAISNGQIFLRSDDRLMAIGQAR